MTVSVYTQDRVQQRIVEQISLQQRLAEHNVDIPVPRGSRDLLSGMANQVVF